MGLAHFASASTLGYEDDEDSHGRLFTFFFFFDTDSPCVSLLFSFCKIRAHTHIHTVPYYLISFITITVMRLVTRHCQSLSASHFAH